MAVAVLAHAALLGLLLHHRSVAIAPMRFPGSAQGTRLSLTYAPGRNAPRPLLAAKAAHPPARLPKALQVAAAPPAPAPAPTSTAVADTAQTSAGNDALGSGNVDIALASYFPTPKPDLSPLSPGTSGDVVLDIVIDATGKVSQITMARGLGHGIDATVIATVQQWNFHPAMRDGQPVPSEQELHFHYERS